VAGGFGDGGAVDVGAYGVEGCAGFDALHLGGEEGEDEGGAHVEEAFGLVLRADCFDGGADLVHVAAEGCLEEGALVGEVLVEGADGDAGACGDAGGGEALFTDRGQNLKGGLENGVDRGVGTGLDRGFAGFQERFGGGGQMRTPKLKIASSKHVRLEEGWEDFMANTKVEKLCGTFTFPGTTLTVKRLGYGAMQLAGKDGKKMVWGPPKDVPEAIAVLREAVASGVNHIDTSDFYGPHVTNQIIREALHPYPDDLVIVTKVGARRGEDGSWPHARSRQEIIDAVHDNLRNLGLDVLDVVNLRLGGMSAPEDEPFEEPLTALAELKQQGLIKHIGLSTVSAEQVATAQAVTEIVCIQNFYNVAQRGDDGFIDDLARQGIAYVPYFPLGGFSPLQSSELNDIAERLGATPMQVALAWLLHRSPNLLLIPGTSSVGHLRENLAAADLELDAETLKELDAIGAGAK